MDKLNEYNNSIIKSRKIPTILDYVKEYNKLPDNIDIEFIEDLLSLVIKKNEFCIHHELMIKYSITNINNGTNSIKKILDKNELKEDIDFKIEQLLDHKNEGRNRNEYYLTQKAFKKCLIRSRNSYEYVNYYICLEEAIYYYNNVDNQLKDKLLKLKDNIINTKQDEIDLLSSDNSQELIDKRYNKLIIMLNSLKQQHKEESTNLDNKIFMLTNQN